MKVLLSDANGEVRATTRRAFITYRKRFENEGDDFFQNLEKNVQKQINEDEKKYGDSIIVDSEDGGEMNYENSKNKSNALFNNSNKSRSHEVKYNLKDNLNNDKANNTYQKEFNNKDIDIQENDLNENLHSKNFTNTTEFSDNTQNEKKENSNSMSKTFKNKGNKSFKGKNAISNYNNANNSKTTKINNKDLLKKLNDKFYNNNIQNFENNNNNYIDSNNPQEIINDYNKKENNDNDKDNDNSEIRSQKYAKPFNSNVNQNQNPNPKIKKNNIIKSNQNNKNNNNLQNNQNNINDVNINNYIENNNNINDNFNININKDSMEYKLIEKINQLSLYNNTKEKLKIFQYLFNSFSEILTDVNNISDITLRQFVDVHIEYIIYEDKQLTEQIIKNLMRMIFYMTQIFTSDDIKLIVKLLMIKINMGEKSVSKLSYELLDLIRKKWRIEDIYYGIFNLLEENKSGYNDVCYEYLTLLVIYCGNIFEDINYFRKIMEIICNGDMNSKKLGKLLEALNKNNPKNFIQTLKEQNIDNQQKILFFLNYNFPQEINQHNQYQNEQNKNKIKKIIHQNKNNTNTNTNNASEEIKKYLENGNVKSFIDYIGNNKSYLPNFLMLLSDEKYLNSVYTKNILNFIYSLVSTQNNLKDELSQNMEILVDQLIHFFLINIKNSLKADVVKEILNLLPIKINSENFYKSISKYLNKNSNVILLQALLICIKNSVVNYKSKNLEKQLPLFINGVLDLLEHPMSDVRKYAIYCCVEIYMVLGHKFDNYLELLPKNQQNLINLFIKKKNC